MRKISATWIFPGEGPPLKHGILTLEDDGSVRGLTDTHGLLREEAGLEHYSGILTPGFVNAYCSLENLSQTGEVSPPQKLQDGTQFHPHKNVPPEKQEYQAMNRADFRMQHEGITAAADLSCSSRTIQVKKNSTIEYHTFIPLSIQMESSAINSYSEALQVLGEYRKAGLKASLTPFTLKDLPELLQRPETDQFLDDYSTIFSHYTSQGTDNTIHVPGTGADELKIDLPEVRNRQSGYSDNLLSRHKIISSIPETTRLILIPDSTLNYEDILAINKIRSLSDTFFVLSPASDTPSISNLPSGAIGKGLNICLRTGNGPSDSNHPTLKVMLTLQAQLPDTPLQVLIEWACINGAKALGINHRAGSFSIGKKPGVNLITGSDLKNIKLTAASKVKVLL